MINDRCINCINYITGIECLAFINNIPDEILLGENDHSKPLPNQENNIIFEPIKS